MGNPPPGRLARLAIPRSGESLVGWVERTASVLDVSPSDLVGPLGFELRPTSDGSVQPRFWGIALTKTTLGRLVAATGLDSDTLSAMVLTAYDGTALDLRALDLADERTVPRLYGQWALLRRSRACPACLGEGAGWQLAWQLGVSAVCLRHRRLLVDQCPTCERPLRSGYGTRRAAVSGRPLPPTAHCSNRARGGFCGAELDVIKSRPATPAELAAQRAVDAVIHAGSGSLCGSDVPAAAWFDLLRRVTQLSRRAQEADRDARSTLRLDHCPASAADAAAVLCEVVPALIDGSMPPSVEPLARSDAFVTYLDRAGLPAPMCAGWTPSRTRRPRPWVEAALRRFGPTGLQITRLSSAVRPEVYNRCIGELLGGTRDRTGRLYTALAAARLAGCPSWDAAAAALGVSTRRARQAADPCGRRVTDPEAFWAGVHRVAVELAALDIDYGSRRRRFADLLSVPTEAWAGLCARHHVVKTEASSRSAALWVWDHVVAGDLRSAPVLSGCGVAPESVFEAYRRFCRRASAELLADLEGWAIGWDGGAA